MIKIFTDSTAYIPADLRELYDISIIPIIISLDGKDYPETELPNSLFFQLSNIGETKVEVKAPDVDYVQSLFEKETDQGNRILGIFISAKMSEMFSVMEKAKAAILKKNPDAKIHLIDSGTNSMHMGLAVLEAAKINKKGQWLENVARAAYEVLRRSRYLFIPSKLKYLHRVGNIDKGPAVIGDLVQMRPILSPIKGQVTPLDNVHTQKKAVDKMVAMMDKDAKEHGLTHIVITHIDAYAKAEQLKKRLESRVDTEIIISDIGPSIGYYIGPGTIGVVYQTENVHPLNEHIQIPNQVV